LIAAVVMACGFVSACAMQITLPQIPVIPATATSSSPGDAPGSVPQPSMTFPSATTTGTPTVNMSGPDLWTVAPSFTVVFDPGFDGDQNVSIGQLGAGGAPDDPDIQAIIAAYPPKWVANGDTVTCTSQSVSITWTKQNDLLVSTTATFSSSGVSFVADEWSTATPGIVVTLVTTAAATKCQ